MPSPTTDIRNFEYEDPKKKHQKAVPLMILTETLRLAKESGDPFSLAIAQQIIGAYLFAMRSCEYSKTYFHEESKRTKILRVKNIRFFLRNRLIQHQDQSIFTSDVVNITFEWQNNAVRNESVSMHSCKHQTAKEFNPVFIESASLPRR